jgi:hypothetical protein
VDGSRVAAALVLCVCLVVAVPAAFGGQESDSASQSGPDQAQPQSAPASEDVPAPYWYDIPQQGFLSLSLDQEEEPDGETLQGLALGYGLWDESDEIGGISFWLSSARGEHQRVSRAGFEALGYFTLPIGPVRVFPTACLGLELREHDPDAGWGGMGSLGLETAIWLGKHLQVAARLERIFEFRTDDRTGLGFRIRWMDERLLAKPEPRETP